MQSTAHTSDIQATFVVRSRYETSKSPCSTDCPVDDHRNHETSASTVGPTLVGYRAGFHYLRTPASRQVAAAFSIRRPCMPAVGISCFPSPSLLHADSRCAVSAIDGRSQHLVGRRLVAVRSKTFASVYTSVPADRLSILLELDALSHRRSFSWRYYTTPLVGGGLT